MIDTFNHYLQACRIAAAFDVPKVVVKDYGASFVCRDRWNDNTKPEDYCITSYWLNPKSFVCIDGYIGSLSGMPLKRIVAHSFPMEVRLELLLDALIYLDITYQDFKKWLGNFPNAITEPSFTMHEHMERMLSFNERLNYHLKENGLRHLIKNED